MLLNIKKSQKACKAAPVCVLAEVFLGMSIWEEIQDRLERTFLLTGLKCHAVFLEELGELAGEREACVLCKEKESSINQNYKHPVL